MSDHHGIGYYASLGRDRPDEDIDTVDERDQAYLDDLEDAKLQHFNLGVARIFDAMADNTR